MAAFEPQFVCVAGDELLTVTVGGRLSVMVKFVRAVSPGAVILIRNREFSPARIVEGEKDLLPLIPPPSVYTLMRADAPKPFVIP